MSRGLDNWLAPAAFMVMINYRVDGDDDDDGYYEVLLVANDDSGNDDDVSNRLQQVICALKYN